MKLIVGLGNPGKKYELTPHNIGFVIIDYLLSKQKNQQIKNQKTADIYYIDTETKILLVKPKTYMNLSGIAIKQILNFYKINLDNVLIIHDDIYLKEGEFKFKLNGGHRGHNGIRNIINILGTKNFKRLKIGVGYDKNLPLENFVLTPMNETKKQKIYNTFYEIEKIIKNFLET